MEPFGLFQFLQNLLSSTAENSTESPSNSTADMKEKNAEAVNETVHSEPNNDAVLQFLAAHDARVKKTKHKP